VLATITIGVDPYIELGPLTLAWHGLTIAIGILIGTLLAERLVRAWGLPSEPIFTAAALAAAGGLIGGRALYVIEQGLLDQPSEWISTRGFSFNGAWRWPPPRSGAMYGAARCRCAPWTRWPSPCRSAWRSAESAT
jgi:hypothetical protein